MSWNNIIPAWMLLDEIKEKEMSEEKLKQDAKRYRYIRQFGDPNFNLDGQALPDEPTSPEEFDAAIDLLMIRNKFEV